MFTELPQGFFDVIYSDPPWKYKEHSQHGGKKAKYDFNVEKEYPTLTIEQLKKLPIKKKRNPNGCILFLWTTGPVLLESLELMKAWGFKYKQIPFVWDKQRVNPGAYTMTQCEFVLVGVYKRIPKPRGLRNVKQLLSQARTKHSAKPDDIRMRIDKMFPNQSKIELFARKSADGWISWGDEI